MNENLDEALITFFCLSAEDRKRFLEVVNEPTRRKDPDTLRLQVYVRIRQTAGIPQERAIEELKVLMPTSYPGKVSSLLRQYRRDFQLLEADPRSADAILVANRVESFVTGYPLDRIIEVGAFKPDSFLVLDSDLKN